MLKETNPQHVTRGATSPAPDDLRKAASAVASILLLSNSVGISRTDPAEGNGYIRVQAVPHSNRNDLDAVLRRRIFISREVDRFEPIHRTITEFLAAEDLSTRIKKGLPIDRVMALICGIDGRPVSSLRGLFAWLMCRVGALAEDYVERDPYGVATYGDAGVLTPGAQCAIWTGLRQLRDPWFLTNQGDRASFRGLANLNTSKILLEFLKAPATGVHLKIAVLEAITNSAENLGLDAVLRVMVLEKNDNAWLRRTALRAFAKSVQNDWVQMEALDRDLAQAADDYVAPEVRADLLRLTQADGSVAQRLLSIMEQAAFGKTERNTVGRFYPLIALPSDSDLDEILDGASRVLISKTDVRLELWSRFDDWFNRRLENPSPITPRRLSNWLRSMQVGRDRFSVKTQAALKVRFERDPLLFEKVFELLSHSVPSEERSFWVFLHLDLWETAARGGVARFPMRVFLDACRKRERSATSRRPLSHVSESVPIRRSIYRTCRSGFRFCSPPK